MGYRAEDFLAWYVRTDEKLGTKTSSVSFSQVEPISEFSTYINDVLTPVVGYRFPTSASISMTYEQFKDYLAYIYDPGENFAYVDSVSVSFNSENALLSTVFNLSKFYIGYEGGAYVGEPEFDVNYGNDNPFRTK